MLVIGLRSLLLNREGRIWTLESGLVHASPYTVGQMDEPGGPCLAIHSNCYVVTMTQVQGAAIQHCKEACGNRKPWVGEEPRPGLLPFSCSPAASWGHRPSPRATGGSGEKTGVGQTAVTPVPKAPCPHYLCQHLFLKQHSPCGGWGWAMRKEKARPLLALGSLHM